MAQNIIIQALKIVLTMMGSDIPALPKMVPAYDKKAFTPVICWQTTSMTAMITRLRVLRKLQIS